MTEKNDKIKLKNVKQSDCRFLYELLSERDHKANISHKIMPIYQQHVKFVMSKPYSKWYIIYQNNKKMGTAYLSKQNEIGLHMKKDFEDDDKIRKYVMNLVMRKNPQKRFLVNVSPRNKRIIKLLKDRGFNLIQYTYELSMDLDI